MCSPGSPAYVDLFSSFSLVAVLLYGAVVYYRSKRPLGNFCAYSDIYTYLYYST
jgi:hypothetical protein